MMCPLSSEPDPQNKHHIYELVKKIITRIIPTRKEDNPITVLIAAAGNGHLSSWLHRQAVNVTALDKDTSRWEAGDVKCLEADLNMDLPLETNHFDLALSVETIEYIEKPYQLLREFARVLKPGGYLIITIPNIHSFKSRMKYPVLDQPLSSSLAGNDKKRQHLSSVSISTLFYAFDNNNMRLVDLYSTGPPRSIITRMIKSFVNAFTFQVMKNIGQSRRHRDNYYLNRLSDRQLRRLIDAVILVVVARKEE